MGQEMEILFRNFEIEMGDCHKQVQRIIAKYGFSMLAMQATAEDWNRLSKIMEDLDKKWKSSQK